MIRQLVRIVEDGLRRRRSDPEIVAQLTAAGVPEANSPALYAAVKAALQQGIMSVLTGGASAPDGPPSDPLLAEAFRAGQENIRFAAKRVWIERAVMLLFVVVIVAFLVYHAVR
jgi:hypothetical protein